MDNVLFLYIGFSLFSITISYGFDAGSDQGACGKPLRSGRAMHKPPCDLSKETFCTSAGNTYPWHAVRRFIRENQGLMRRMYGDEKHLAVLKAEIDNEVDEYENDYSEKRVNEDLYKNGDFKTRYSKQDHLLFDDNELFDEARYIHQDADAQDRKEEIILNTKFVYSQEPGMQIKLKEVLQAPKFTQKQPVAAAVANKDELAMTPKTNAETFVPTDNNSNTQIAFNVQLNNENASEKAVAKQNSSKEETNKEFAIATTASTTSTTSTSTENINISTTSTTSEKVSDLDAHETSATSAGADFYEEETTTQETYDPTETPNDKRRPVGEMLFQDFQDADKGPHKDYNYNNKLRGVNACPVKEEVVAPFWANNTRGEVLALLNLYPFEQYVHWEKCTYEHRKMYCREGCVCEQQYRLHRLLAYDPQNECRGIFSDWFRFPSCCVCKCYDMPAEFRVTSRSPRSRKEFEEVDAEQDAIKKDNHEKPNTWFSKKKLNMKQNAKKV